jgi:hypothetical protein
MSKIIKQHLLPLISLFEFLKISILPTFFGAHATKRVKDTNKMFYKFGFLLSNHVPYSRVLN